MALEQPMYQTALALHIVDEHAPASPAAEARGAIYTRREVVDFILDLVGYTVDRDLVQLRLLEPAIGHGAFLLPAIDRLLAAWRSHTDTNDIAALKPAIRGVELHPDTFVAVRECVIEHLFEHGLLLQDATTLADAWLLHSDFLGTDFDTRFDVIIGNPPYVRQELVPDTLMATYRARFTTIYDRADLYIPFLEHALRLLTDGGQLGCICADRWTKNRYGGPLRQLVAEHFHLKTYVDMVDTPAFDTDVIAYPAITVIARQTGSLTRVAQRPSIEATALSWLAKQLTAAPAPDTEAVRTLRGVVAGAEPWIVESADQLALVRRLEAAYPTLEEAGCTVGIGVATGADTAFIGPLDALAVEADRKLPLVTTRDIRSGNVKWGGLGVINPFAAGGGLVPLDTYPRLKRYLEDRKSIIAARHIARKTPAQWYRTIDRINPALAATPKLLIPDIKGEAHIVYEDGQLYPHHNLYYITSDIWDLKALQAVLQSGIARLFVAIYSTRMRGGYLRFQAQYLRRIRVPHWHTVPDALKQQLMAAAACGDTQTCNACVAVLYSLSKAELDVLGATGV